MYLKTLGLLLAVAFILVNINGCKKPETQIPRIYQFHLMFTDQDGKNLLKNVQADILKNDIVISSNDGEIKTSSFTIIEFDNQRYLQVQASTLHHVILGQINYSITNKDLMGTETHQINTQWHLEKHTNVITALQVDNKSLEQINEPFKHYKLVKPL
jgi:hypothetical protein